MCVRVLLADDAEVVRNAIHILLSLSKDISLVGETATFSEAVQMANELKPNVVVLDLRMVRDSNQQLPTGTKILAVSFANDDEAKALAESIGAAKFLDKIKLSAELIPAILELASKHVVSI